MTIYSLDVLLSQLEPVHCPMSSFNCCFLFCIQVSQGTGKIIWYSHLFKNFPQLAVIHTVKGFSIVNEAEVHGFLELPYFLFDPTDVDNLLSGSSAFSKPSLYIWKLSVHILLKPSLKDFEHNLMSIWNECNFTVVCFAMIFYSLWIWNILLKSTEFSLQRKYATEAVVRISNT